MVSKRQNASRTRRRRSTVSNEGRALMLEFLLVTFPEERAVLADDQRVGWTNHMIMIPADEYTITLDGGGCSPDSVDVVIAGTSIMRPKVVAFVVPAAIAASVPAASPRSVSAANATAAPATRATPRKS
jgi:hypothetical protein